MTTGHRWVHKLVGEDLVTLRPDRFDLRRQYVELTHEAFGRLDQYFADACGSELSQAA